MSTVTKTILDAAVRTGSGVVKDIVSAQLGPTLGGLAGVVIDTVATTLGVSPADIPDQPTASIDAAVSLANEDPTVLKLYIEQQKTTNDLLKAEMEKSESLWTWAWRPAWMWFLMFLWAWNGVLANTVNGVLQSNIALVPYDALAAVTAAYTAFYLGGHTAKSIFSK